MNTLYKVRLWVYIAIFTLCVPVKSDISDYIYPSKSPSFGNFGGLGVLQNPSARFYDEGSIAFNWVQNGVYRRGSIVMYPFDWFEFSYQYTDIDNAKYSLIKEFSGGQSYKDKSFDAKAKIFSERGIFPSVAIGARDLAGTGIFGAEYVVANKQVSNIDFSLGMGWGILSGNKITNPLSSISDSFDNRTGVGSSGTMGGDFNVGDFFSGDAGIFAGAEIFIPNLNGSRFKVEYDGTNYEKEGFPLGRESFNLAYKPIKKPDSKFNFGFIYPLTDNFHLKASITKGNTFSFGFSFHAGIKGDNPKIVKTDRHEPVENAEQFKAISKGNDTYIYRSILKHLNDRNLYLQKAEIKNKTLEVQYAQDKYISYARATGRITRVLDEVVPDEIDTFKLANTNAGMNLNTITIDRHDYNLYESTKDHNSLRRSVKISNPQYDPKNYSFAPDVDFPAFFWKAAPSIRSQIGGPDGFYFGDLSLAIHTELLFRYNLSLVTSGAIGIVDNFDELKLASDSILPHVRTDIVKYLKQSRKGHFKRIQLNWFHRPTKNLYAKLSAGIFEPMFGGYGFETLYRPFNSTFAIGMEYWNVKQRDYDQMFKFLDYETETGHINIFYEEPRTQLLLRLKGGRFLAKDSGINFDLSRRFKSGLRIGAFFSRTDISKEEFGEGSFDKGFYFYVPIEFFFDQRTKGIAGFGLRPLTRDGAQYLVHSHHLYGITDQANSYNINRNWEDFYD